MQVATDADSDGVFDFDSFSNLGLDQIFLNRFTALDYAYNNQEGLSADQVDFFSDFGGFFDNPTNNWNEYLALAQN